MQMVQSSFTMVKQKLFEEEDSYIQLTQMCEISGMIN